MKTLFENDYCKIVENTKGEWFRLDKILGTSMQVMSYFDNDGSFIAHNDR
jgi:hypothetical protein